MATYQKKDWTNELGQPTHIIKRTGCKVMIFGNESGLLHCLTNNEASVWVERRQLTEV